MTEITRHETPTRVLGAATDGWAALVLCVGRLGTEAVPVGSAASPGGLQAVAGRPARLGP